MATRAFYTRAVVVGLLIAVGAFAIDMYIPGFAAIAAELHTDPGTVQLSMTAFFVALGAGQVFWGPLSDSVGRRGPIFAGLALFAVASAAAAFAPGIGWLIAARFVQGLGAAGATVVPMAVIRDEHTGPDAAQMLSLAILSLSISPILAPVAGGFMVQYVSWRLIFVVLVAIGLGTWVLTHFLLPETHPPDRRVSARPLPVLLTYGRLLKNRRFLVPVLIAGCGQALLFLFISGAPFVIVTLHGVSPTNFGLLFALHAMTLIGLSQLNAKAMRRFGALRIMGVGSVLATLAGLALFALIAGGMTALWPLLALTLTIFASLSLILGPAFLTAMEPFGATAGAAAALATGMEFACSSTMTGLMGVLADGTALPMAALLAVTACGSLAAWIWLARMAK